MEAGDILLVREDLSTLKLFNINSKLSFTIQNGQDEMITSQSLQAKEREKSWLRMSQKAAQEDCFLSHEKKGGSIPISSLIQLIKPEIFSHMATDPTNELPSLETSDTTYLKKSDTNDIMGGHKSCGKGETMFVERSFDYHF